MLEFVEVEYTIDINSLEDYLCKKDSRINHDLIWDYLSSEHRGQDTFSRINYDNLIDCLSDYLWDMNPTGESDPEDANDFAALPITAEMDSVEVLYRTILHEMIEENLPDEFLLKFWW